MTQQLAQDELETFLEKAPAAALITNHQGQIIFINRQAAALFGYSTEELAGRGVEILLPEQLRQSHAQYRENYYAAPQTRVMNPGRALTGRRKDGSEVPVEISLSPVEAAGGLRVVCFVNDLSPPEEKLPLSPGEEESCRLLVESMNQIVYMLALSDDPPKARFQFVSRQVEEILGYQPDEFVHNSELWRQIVHPEDQPDLIEASQKLVAGGQRESRHYRVRHKITSEYRWLEEQIAPYFDAQGRLTGMLGIVRDATDEAQLRHISNAVKQVADSVLITNPNGFIEYVNPAFEETTGYSYQEVIGQKPDLLKSGKHNLNFYNNLWQTILSGEVFRAVFTNQRKDGALYYEDRTITPIRNNRGAITHFISTGRDITERRLALRALRQSERNYRQLMEQAADAILIFDRRQNCVDANSAACRLLGYSRSEMLQLNAGQLLTYGEQAADPKHLRQLWAGKTITAEYRLQRRDQTTIPVEVSVKQLSDGRFQAIARDISHRKRLETQLKAIYRLGQELTLLHDEEIIIHRVLEKAGGILPPAATISCGLLDSAARSLLIGYRMERGQIIKLDNALPLSLDNEQSLAAAAINQKKFFYIPDLAHSSYSCCTKNESPHGSALCIPLQVREKMLGILCVESERPNHFSAADRQLLETLTSYAAVALENARLHREQQEQRRQLQETQTQLVQAAKMSALGRLVASIAHEINNPLQSVQTCLTLAQEELEETALQPKPAKVDRYLTIVQEELDRVAAIIRHMRDFYRPAHKEWQPTNIHEILESVLALIAKQLKNSDIVVRQEWAQNLPLIMTNPNHLKQVFLNLLLNAVDAMPNGGEIVIAASLDQLTGAGPRLTIPAARIDFSDTGGGIPDEVLERLFEPFVTAKKEGSGLGLSISYMIIEASGGEIRVNNRPGEGATFTILLPAPLDTE